MTAHARQALTIMRIYWLQAPGSFLFMLFDTLLLPAIMIYLALRLAPQPGPAQSRWLAGALTLGVGTAASTRIGFAVLADRMSGRLALLRTTQAAAPAYMLAHVGTAMALGLISVAGCLLLLSGLGLVAVTPALIPAALLVALATGAVVGGLGAAVGAGVPDAATGRTWIALASTALIFLSPVFYDSNLLPRALQLVTWLSPFTHAAALNLALVQAQPLPWLPLLATLGLGFAANALAYGKLAWR